MNTNKLTVEEAKKRIAGGKSVWEATWCWAKMGREDGGSLGYYATKAEAKEACRDAKINDWDEAHTWTDVQRVTNPDYICEG